MAPRDFVKFKLNILILCEGYEEFDYVNRLKECKVWSEDIVVAVENVKSLTRAYLRYEYLCGIHTYDAVFIFCDTETAPFDFFNKMKNEVVRLRGESLWNKIIAYVNPCTMQVILSHLASVSLRSNLKSVNASLIEKLTGVKEYSAKQEQRNSIMRKINASNYADMKANISKLSDKDYTVTPSTNVLSLFEALETCDREWFDPVVRA